MDGLRTSLGPKVFPKVAAVSRPPVRFRSARTVIHSGKTHHTKGRRGERIHGGQARLRSSSGSDSGPNSSINDQSSSCASTKVKQKQEGVVSKAIPTLSQQTSISGNGAFLSHQIHGYAGVGRCLMSRQMSKLTLSRSDWIQGSKIAHWLPFVRHMSLLRRRTRGLVALWFLGFGRGAREIDIHSFWTDQPHWPNFCGCSLRPRTFPESPTRPPVIVFPRIPLDGSVRNPEGATDPPASWQTGVL